VRAPQHVHFVMMYIYIYIYIERERERERERVDHDTHLTHEFDKKVPQATQCVIG
jgi:hypothetical protein